MNLELNLEDGQARVRLRWLAPNAVRITHAAPGDADFPADRPWLNEVLVQEGAQAVETPEWQVELLHGCVQARTSEGLVFSEKRPARLGIRKRCPYFSLDIPKTEARFGIRQVENGVSLAFAIQAGEGFYGWGEWFNAFRRQEGQVRLRIRDAIALLQGRETYSAIPMVYSSRGYAVWLLNSHTSRWRIDPKAGNLQVEADGPGADYILFYGPSFKRILRTYTALTGRPPLPPRWAFGLWVTSYPQGDQEGVLAHLQEHRRRAIPLDAVILDYHWEEAFHNFQWRRSLFPAPQQFIASLKQLGVRLGLIQTPFVNQRNRPLQKRFLNALAHNLPPGLEQNDERDLEGYQQARSQGLLAHDQARWWFGAGGMPDFANPKAAQWWNARMRPLYEQGVSFFKNDDGEYLPEDARSSLGMDGREYHNLYGFFYGKALYEGAPEFVGRPLIYARSVWAGSQRYPALFLGDQKPTSVGMRSTLRAGLNLGLLGFAYWTADVFGLDGKTTPEMHMRYAQWALLSPVARYFWRPPQIDDTRFPWSHGLLAEENFRKYAELRYRLLPYFLALAWEAYQTGIPLLRPLVLEFQDDVRLAAVDDQVMIGENWMLCPVFGNAETTRRIVLPAGTWHDFWSGQSWQGPGVIEYSAPLDRLPLLARGGAAIPLGPPMQSIPDDHRLDQIEWHFWPPYPARGVLYDDDGRTQDYCQGHYSLTEVVAQEQENVLSARIGAAQGGFAEQVRQRQVTLVFHRAKPVQDVHLNVEAACEWRYDPENREIVVQTACPVDFETVVECFHSR
jgi:alpha-glucosidase (family GH31 glycosyl hydrolase)